MTEPLFTSEDVVLVNDLAYLISDADIDQPMYLRARDLAGRLQQWLDQQHDPHKGRPLMVFNDATQLWDRARQQDLDVGQLIFDIPDIASPLPGKEL